MRPPVNKPPIREQRLRFDQQSCESFIALMEMFSDNQPLLHGAAGELAMDVGDALIAFRQLRDLLAAQPEGREHEFEIVGMWDGSTARWTAYEPVTGDYLFRPRRPQHDRLKDRRTIMCPVDGACDDDQCRLTQKCQKRHYAAEESRKEMK
jgi:hypothetical protein